MIELTRTTDDRRRYLLDGVGTLRFHGFWSRGALAEADGGRWEFGRRGFWQRVMRATDATGTAVGEFVPRDIRRGGRLVWGDRELDLTPVSPLRERYALSDGERDLAIGDARGWGRRPVRITLARPDVIDPGLLLFVVYVVGELAVNAVSASSAGSVAATSGSLSC